MNQNQNLHPNRNRNPNQNLHPNQNRNPNPNLNPNLNRNPSLNPNPNSNPKLCELKFKYKVQFLTQFKLKFVLKPKSEIPKAIFQPESKFKPKFRFSNF